MAATAGPLTFYDLAPEPGACPYAQRAWITLVELDVPFKTKFVDKANKSEEFLSLFREITQDPAGRGTVPTIIDGNFKLTESVMVVEYLDKKYGKSGKTLLPENPEQYAMVKLFVETYMTHVTGNLFKLLKADTQASLAEAVKSAEAGAKVVNDFIARNGSNAGGGFFLGSTYSYAEAMTTPFLKRELVALPHIGKWDLLQYAKSNSLDRLVSWIEASMSRPSASKTGCSDEQLISTLAQFNQPLKD